MASRNASGSGGSKRSNGQLSLSPPSSSRAPSKISGGGGVGGSDGSGVRGSGAGPGSVASSRPTGSRPPASRRSSGSSSVASNRRSHVKSYSYRDESIAGESVISLGSIDENGDFVIPEELIRSIGMDCYSVEEKAQLDNLLQRLLATKKQDDKRKEKLRRELDRMRAQVSRVQNKGDKPGLLYNLCELCGARLYLVNRQYVCTQCSSLACQTCVYLVRGSEPQCRLCRLEVLNKAKSGDWFLDEARQRANPPFFGPDILHASLCKERQRMIAEERLRREQQKAEVERQQRQQLQETEQKGGKKGKKKDKKGETAGHLSDLSEASNLRPSNQLQQPPAVSIRVNSPSGFEREIQPEDSVSVLGYSQNLDYPDGDILIEQATAAAADNRRQRSPTDPQLRLGSFPRGSNLRAVDATSRESMVSNVSENEDSYAHGLTPCGEVEIKLQYNYKERKFTVNVVQCRNLAALEGNPPNPYVKTYLLPDKTKRSKRRTQTRRATANPIYSEQLVYDIAKSELETRTLQVSVWHSLTFGSNVFLGETRVSMENYRFEAGHERLPLEKRMEIPVPLPTLMYRGDIMLSLRYVSGELIKANQLAKDDAARREAGLAGRLEVWVQNCRNLAGSGNNASPYVKGYLLNPASTAKARGRDPKSKQKSAIVKGDTNPNFNSILAFSHVSLADLKFRSLELTVWDHVKFGKNDFLGGVRLNIGDGHHPCMDARGHEGLMWTRMLEKPNAWVEGSLLLRPNMDPQEIQKPLSQQQQQQQLQL